MPDPKKKLNAQQKKELNSYIDQLSFRNNLVKKYQKQGINIADKKFQDVNFKNDTIIKLSKTGYGKQNLSSHTLDKNYNQYSPRAGREELSHDIKKKTGLGGTYQTETKIIKYSKKGPKDFYAPYRWKSYPGGAGNFKNPEHYNRYFKY